MALLRNTHTHCDNIWWKAGLQEHQDSFSGRVSNNVIFCFLSNHLNKNVVCCIICWSYFSSWNMNYESFWNTSANSSCNMAWLYSLYRSPQLIAFRCKSCFCFIKLTFPLFFPSMVCTKLASTELNISSHTRYTSFEDNSDFAGPFVLL